MYIISIYFFKGIVNALQFRFKYVKLLFMKTGCFLCPAACGAHRETEAGECGGGNKIKIAKYGLHFYEEPCISFKRGSGAIFFCGCSLKCVFCQNYELSRALRGKEIDEKELARIFFELEERGAENINLVTAGHYIPQLCRAFHIYRPKIPVVYNTHSYENVKALEAIDPFVDIYLPDLKYRSPKISERYTGKANYFAYASRAVEFMMKKPLDMRGGKIYSGCIVRHLVLPLCANDSIEIIKWFYARESEAYFSLMGQYIPCGDIEAFPELQRRITRREYSKAADFLCSCGNERVFLQELSSADEKYIPDWDY